MTRVFLKSGREESLKRFHPWIFSGAIKRTQGTLEEGCIVEVWNATNEFIGIGHYQTGSIAVRMLSFVQSEIDQAFYEQALQNAHSLRKKLGLTHSTDTTAYRLVHGEGDKIPGLVVDIYGDTAVLQAHSVGIYKQRQIIASALCTVFGNDLKAIYDKSSSTVPFAKQLEAVDGYLWGESGSMIAKENNNSFHINWEQGQKTGFFIDQRENRMLLERYCNNASVLNLFCYTGGFSVYALRGKAQLVHSVDSSAKAIALCDQNIHLNFGDTDKHKSFTVDAFDHLYNNDQKYDVIVLDPPAFAKHQSALRNALQAYKRVNAKAIERIKPGGMLFTYSCSQAVSKEQFLQAIFSAAAIAGRHVRIIHRMSQPADHPVSIYHPEGEYLKGLVLYIE